jgi:FkbM family methyltransferase
MKKLRDVRKSVRALIRKIRQGMFSRWARISFSQECEDLLIIDQLGKLKKGFFVDVGGLHPKRFSNTYLLYKMGWRGIVVEPNPDAEKLFRKTRRRDIFIPEGVAASTGSMEYFRFEEPALNTFDAELASIRENEEGRRIKDRISRKISPLGDILDAHLPKGTHIDVMSIDVEGLDEEVLRSNHWNKYRPKWLVVEIDLSHANHGWIIDLPTHPTMRFLISVGYQAVIKTGRSIIFKRVAEQLPQLADGPDEPATVEYSEVAVAT